MRKLGKTFIAALVAGSALSVAIPAHAQYYPQQHRDDDRRWDRDGDHRWDRDDDRRWDHNNGQANAIRQQIEQLRQRIARIDARDRISEREAAGLRRAVHNLREQFRDFNRNGLSQREAQILRQRIQQIRARLQFERRDNDGRRW
jgi:Spy/CpxP family protein refolding chaperone